MNSKIISQLKNSTSAKILLNESLKKHTTYGVGGDAELMIIPSNKDDLKNIMGIASQNNEKITILGSGSNVLISDNGIKGVTISLKGSLDQVNIDGEALYAECGARLGKVVKESIKHDLIGLENLVGVPGTLGGALIMNAGAWGGEISQYLESVEAIVDGHIKRLKSSDIKFSYRNSSFKKDTILLSANFKLKKSDSLKIKKNLMDAQDGRKNTQPLNKRSAGSLFKNPANNSAGKLIDEAGLKGFSIGDAKISTKHANFLINDGKATSHDMIQIIKKVRNTVKERFNIMLELEVKLIGFNKNELGELSWVKRKSLKFLKT